MRPSEVIHGKAVHWSLFFGTLVFEGHLMDTSISGRHKIWSRKNVHIIFVFVTSIEGTAHLCSGEWDTFLGPET